MTRVQITDPRRAADWRRVFGTDALPVKSAAPFPASVPGKASCLVYLVDLDQVAGDCFDRLVGFLVERFGLRRDEVIRDLTISGLPIVADDCRLVEDEGFGHVKGFE